MSKLISKLLSLLLFSSTLGYCHSDFPLNNREVHTPLPIFEVYQTPYGECHIDDPLAIELIHSKLMKRLHHIDQSGVVHYFGYAPKFTRFEHSIGVYALLKKFGASRVEQIAGLLHDTSHTVFSHLGDYIFHEREHDQESYQDTIFEWYLKEMGLEKIIKKHGYSIQQFLPKQEKFRALEQDLPYMCADRIEYNLHTAYLFDLLSREQIGEIINDLRYENGHWYFTNQESAKTLGLLSLYFTENFWGSPKNFLIHRWSTKLMQRAIKHKLIDFHDIHFSEDHIVFNRLLTSDDPKMIQMIQLCFHINNYFTETTNQHDSDLVVHQKFRGIDPLVLENGRLTPLSELSTSFAKEFKRVETRLKKGVFIRLKNSAREKMLSDFHNLQNAHQN